MSYCSQLFSPSSPPYSSSSCHSYFSSSSSSLITSFLRFLTLFLLPPLQDLILAVPPSLSLASSPPRRAERCSSDRANLSKWSLLINRFRETRFLVGSQFVSPEHTGHHEVLDAHMDLRLYVVFGVKGLVLLPQINSSHIFLSYQYSLGLENRTRDRRDARHSTTEQESYRARVIAMQVFQCVISSVSLGNK